MFDMHTSRLKRKIKEKCLDLKKEFKKSMNDLVDNDSLKKSGKSKSTGALNEMDPHENYYSYINRSTDCLTGVKPTALEENDLDDSECQEKEKFGEKLKRKSQQLQMYLVKKYEEIDNGYPFLPWHYVVSITLIEGKNALCQTTETFSTYVTFKLGNQSYTSRKVYSTENPRWLERIFFHVYEKENEKIDVVVWNSDKKNESIGGRCSVDLSTLKPEQTHEIKQRLVHPSSQLGTVHFTVTISGLIGPKAVNDLERCQEDSSLSQKLNEKYDLFRTLADYKDVGFLTVKVLRANGVSAVNLSGSSNPFCVVELGNDRFQTHAVQDTLSPVWNRIFYFNVRDINDFLEVIVYDEYRDHTVEILGKVVIPLLEMCSGESKWWPLKDKKLRQRANGVFPHILLQFDLVWNPARACIASIGTKEEKYIKPEVKFKSHILLRNVARLKSFVNYFMENGKHMQNLLESDSKVVSLVALAVWLLVCFLFEPWMLPAIGLCLFFKEYMNKFEKGSSSEQINYLYIDDEDSEIEDKKGVTERLQSIPEVMQTVQNSIGLIASVLERLKNIFNFSVPFMSFIAFGLLLLATIILYLVPLRYLLMLCGLNIFLRKVVGGQDYLDFKLIDFIMRVPDDEMMADFRELLPIVERVPVKNKRNKGNNSTFYVKHNTE